MTQAASKLTLLQRVTRVTLVAVCTASSLTLLGAVPAKWASNRKSDNVVVKPVIASIALPQLAAVTRDSSSVELLQDVATATPAPAAIVAVPKARTLRMEVTAYCACPKCCGPNAHGVTASGRPVSYNEGKFVAADTSVLPFGTKLVIPGYAGNEKVQVLDRGGAIKGNKLDLFFPTHDAALVWGRQTVEVTIYE